MSRFDFVFHFLYLYSLVLCVFRLAGQTASRAVSLFLDGDVSFLPDNSFPSTLQLLKVGIFLQYKCTLNVGLDLKKINK